MSTSSLSYPKFQKMTQIGIKFRLFSHTMRTGHKSFMKSWWHCPSVAGPFKSVINANPTGTCTKPSLVWNGAIYKTGQIQHYCMRSVQKDASHSQKSNIKTMCLVLGGCLGRYNKCNKLFPQKILKNEDLFPTHPSLRYKLALYFWKFMVCCEYV